jgi:hypothetical protein
MLLLLLLLFLLLVLLLVLVVVLLERPKLLVLVLVLRRRQRLLLLRWAPQLSEAVVSPVVVVRVLVSAVLEVAGGFVRATNIFSMTSHPWKKRSRATRLVGR